MPADWKTRGHIIRIKEPHFFDWGYVAIFIQKGGRKNNE